MSSNNAAMDVAQSNLRLYRQLEQSGYGPGEVDDVARAYLQAVPMFSALYRGNGKPFINHLVGTASILVSRRSPLEQVLAGLFHAAYQSGDFGSGPGGGRSRRRRQYLRNLVGSETEELVAVYDAMDWADCLSRGEPLVDIFGDTTERSVAYIFLANTLEDFLDGGMNGLGPGKKKAVRTPDQQRQVVALAGALSWPELGEQLQGEFAQYKEALAVAPSLTADGLSTMVLPPASRRALVPLLKSAVLRRLRRAGLVGV